MKAVVSEKGQVTIPKSLRDRLGIHAGETLDFEADAGRLVATKIVARDPVDAVFGVLELPDGTDAVIAALRGEGPAE
jgi:AbrB family looped-hinge helix DNA binding protein